MYNFSPTYNSKDVFNYIKAYGINKASKFSGTFEEKLYENTYNKVKRLGISEVDWPYYSLEEDFYTYNSYGYRTDEFDTYVNDKFDLIFGCSFVEGIGVRKHEMWVHHYEQLLSTRTVNLAKGGNSNNNIKNVLFSWILSNKPKPKRILLCWTEPTRNTYVRTSGFPVHLNPLWKLDNLFDETDSIINELYSVRLKSNVLWSNEFIEDFTAVNSVCKLWGVNVYNLFNNVSWNENDIRLVTTYTGVTCNTINYDIDLGWDTLVSGKKFFPAADGIHYGAQHQFQVAQQIKNIISYEKN